MAESNNTHDSDSNAAPTFLGSDTLNSSFNGPSPAAAAFDFPSFSSSDGGIVMLSLPDTQDVFLTPPEESSLPSITSSGAVDRCAVNLAVNADAGSQGFVELGRDSDLGFSEVQLQNGMDVDDCSHGVQEDALDDMRGCCQFDEFAVFEKEYSDLGQSPLEKSKLSECGLGFDSLQKVEEDMGLVNEENDISVNKSCSETVACAVEGNKSSDGVAEASGTTSKSDEGTGLSVMSSSIGSESAAADSEMEEEGGGNSAPKIDVFELLRVLSENSDAAAAEENHDPRNLFDVIKAHGVDFPRPGWWPDGFE